MQCVRQATTVHLLVHRIAYRHVVQGAEHEGPVERWKINRLRYDVGNEISLLPGFFDLCAAAIVEEKPVHQAAIVTSPGPRRAKKDPRCGGERRSGAGRGH